MIILAPLGKFRDHLIDKLAVDPGRIEFVERRPRLKYLELYHSIDLCLDTFPYNGHTTSLDALWMGVPVVSLCGRTAVARAGFSQMSNLGMLEFVAGTAEEYVGIARQVAGDSRRLAAVRASLRGKMRRSPLMDNQHFARHRKCLSRSMVELVQWKDAEGTHITEGACLKFISRLALLATTYPARQRTKKAITANAGHSHKMGTARERAPAHLFFRSGPSQTWRLDSAAFP